jgi:NDP-sugar pyrophosphorylase family protein
MAAPAGFPVLPPPVLFPARQGLYINTLTRVSMSLRPALVVLAAGMATRYGRLKQLDPFGPNGETIIEYAVYDAIRAGFGKVVFVIRQSIEQEFKAALADKLAGKIEVAFVRQELNTLPAGFTVPDNRVKPWGTGHAVWVAGAQIAGPFAVINGDDYYGYSSLKIIADFLADNPAEEYGLVGFELNKTLSDHGAVSRGICAIDARGYLESVTEQTHIEQTDRGIVARTAGNGEVLFQGNERVSLNLFGFPPSVLPYFEEYLVAFLQQRAPEPGAEFFLPAVVDQLIQTGRARVKVLPTEEKWFGVTYPADKPVAVQTLRELIGQGTYPEHLWNGQPENGSNK